MLLTKEDALAKMSEQLGEAKKIKNDPTNSMLVQFQRILSIEEREEVP